MGLIIKNFKKYRRIIKIALICYKKTDKIILPNETEGDIIRKLTLKKKIWLDKRNIKIQKRQRKFKKIRNNNGRLEYISNNKRHTVRYYVNHEKKHFFVVPENFSLENNPEETIHFFRELMNLENLKIANMHFFIDSSKVKTLTVDAIMYLIAVMNDVKANKKYSYQFAGNLPSSKEAKEVYINSGFMSFVKSDGKYNIGPENKKIQIMRGTDNDPETAKKACQYVQLICGLSIIDTRPLYNIIIEMMGNTKQHAYEDKMTNREKCWYLFAEETDCSVKFVFLDTGLGIPSTIRRTLKDVVSKKTDGEYIRSTLNGEFRTQTKKPNRGKGLPQISGCFKRGLLSNVYICSGKGSCTLNENKNEYRTKEYKQKIFGTLFSWEIKKGMNNCD